MEGDVFSSGGGEGFYISQIIENFILFLLLTFSFRFFSLHTHIYSNDTGHFAAIVRNGLAPACCMETSGIRRDAGRRREGHGAGGGEKPGRPAAEALDFGMWTNQLRGIQLGPSCWWGGSGMGVNLEDTMAAGS